MAKTISRQVIIIALRCICIYNYICSLQKGR